MSGVLRIALVVFSSVAFTMAAHARKAPPPQSLEAEGVTYGPQARFKGILSTAFELYAFENCWFANSPEFYRRFESIGLPEILGFDLVEYEVEFIGRRSVPDQSSGRDRYGHLGGFSCQIRGEKLISARIIRNRSRQPPPAR